MQIRKKISVYFYKKVRKSFFEFAYFYFFILETPKKAVLESSFATLK